jgi:hypothetical protein
VGEGPVGYVVLEDGPDGTFPYLHTNLRSLGRLSKKE